MDCITNIDWLEIYCIEDPSYMRREVFEREGYRFLPKDYGTRIYEQIIEIQSHRGIPLYTICRCPKSSLRTSAKGILHEYAMHIKVQNWLLYTDHYIDNLISFLNCFHIEFKSISRLDVCCDLQHFKYGLKPITLLNGYLRGKYYKVKQNEFAVYGKDRGNLTMNSIKFGSQSSNIFARMYNKTLELQEQKDKPYIRDIWRAQGLDINKDVWRVEISLKGNGRHLYDKRRKQWAEVADDETGDIQTRIIAAGEKPKNVIKYSKILNIEINLETIDSEDKVRDLFLSLASSYFRFRKAQGTKRRDKCPLVELFDASSLDRCLVQRPTVHFAQSGKTDRMVVHYLHNLATEGGFFSDKELENISLAMRSIIANKRLSKWYFKTFMSIPYPSNIEKKPLEKEFVGNLPDIY